MSTSSSSMVTAEELSRMSLPGKQVELVRGELLVREPPAAWHGAISNRIAHRLTGFVEERGLGAVFGQDTGFQIAAEPDTVRAPDVAFVPGEVLAKTGEWLEAGVRLVWVLDPESRQARVHRPDGSLALLDPEDVLDGADVLPGFRCAVAEILKPGW